MKTPEDKLSEVLRAILIGSGMLIVGGLIALVLLFYQLMVRWP